MSMTRYPVVSVCGPQSCPDALLRAMADLEMKGFLVIGPHIWDGVSDSECPIRDYNAYNRWKLMTRKGRAKLDERINDLRKQRISMSQRLVVVDVDGVDDPGYMSAIKRAFSYGICVEVWEYAAMTDQNGVITGYKRVREKLINTLADALFD